MLKKIIKKTVLKMFPELSSNMHVVQLALVVAIPDPPINGEICTEITPKYAVDCKLLKNDFTVDDNMPIMRDVPVAMIGSSSTRGLAMLPQVGTIVEIAFAFGLQTHPFIRTVLPYNKLLPQINENTIRLQQNPIAYSEIKDAEASIIAPKIWVGNSNENILHIISEFMQTTKAAFSALATHVHGDSPAPNVSAQVSENANTINAQKVRLDIIKK